MLLELIKALLIGIIASAPIGPVFILVMQKTFCHGRMAGFAAGLGSALVDTLYAVASLFALMFVQEFIQKHEPWIFIAGGLLVVLVGYTMLRRKPLEDKVLVAETSKAKAVRYALEAAGCALANPGALAYMFALVAVFRLDISKTVSPVWLVIIFILAGAIIWWFSFAIAADKLRENFKAKTLNRVNLLAGLTVIAFGLALVVRGIFI